MGDNVRREAMVREARKESGIDINPENLHLFHVMHRHTGDERISSFFTTDNWRGEPRNMEPSKCDDLAWFSVDSMPINTVMYVRTAISRGLDGIKYSEFGWSSDA